jgi:hypothetical protein
MTVMRGVRNMALTESRGYKLVSGIEVFGGRLTHQTVPLRTE